MASDTLSEIREQALVAADVSSDDPKFSTANTTPIINKALRHCSTKFDPWWLQTSANLAVTAGTVNYATSSLTRFYKVQRIEDNSGFVLTGLNKHELSRYTRQTQKPTGYLVEEGFIKLGPTSDAAYTYVVHFYQYETPLSGDDDQPALPQQYTGWLVDVAAEIMAAKARDWETASYLKANIKGWEERISDDMRQMKAPPRIVTRDETQWV